MNPFDAASPLDARYYLPDPDFFQRLSPYVSEAAQIRYLARVEGALARVLARSGVCSHQVADEIRRASEVVPPEEVYQEERRIQHNIRALVNCIRNRVSDAAKPYVHLFATSADIVDSARALSLKDVTNAVIVPSLTDLLKKLIRRAREAAGMPQIGRTHGQHAVPITWGFALAQFVSRLGQRLEVIRAAADNLRGKFAGAVGAYNALALLRPDAPQDVEAMLMAELGLKAPEVSTQIVQPEYVADYVYALASAWGVLADLADDIRHLMRSEIKEIRDRRSTDQETAIVGSSTMPHKVNPKDFENVKSLWKAYVPRLVTVLMDQLSEHQRDLTNSASGRFVTEFVTAFAYGVYRLAGSLDSVEPDAARMHAILEEGKDPVVAEPLYVLLSLAGHPDAHEAARVLAREARIQQKPLAHIIRESTVIRPYLEKLRPEQRAVLEDPARYRGAAEQRTREICDAWEKKLAGMR
jgi:adenylosuccinate lyase